MTPNYNEQFRIRSITCRDGMQYSVGKPLTLQRSIVGGTISHIDSESGMVRVSCDVKTLDKSTNYKVLIPEDEVYLVAFYSRKEG